MRSSLPSRLASLSLADRLGLAALLVASLLLVVDLRWAVAPLLAYLGMTALAPFLPRLPYFLPIVSHGPRQSRRVALTFDDGPNVSTTMALLELLKERGVHATFFLVGDRIMQHPDLVAAIVGAGHEIGNHSARHDPLLMLRSSRRLIEDLASCQRAILAQGVCTRVFRPPVGITNPRLRGALGALGLLCVTYDCRALDIGNRRVTGLAKRLLRCARPGSILLLHDRQPRQGIDAWLAEIGVLLDGLERRQLEPVRLGALLGFSVNERARAEMS